MARRLIPAPLIGVLSEVIANAETHASLDSLFLYADAPGDPPLGNKQVKVQEWLRRSNKDEKCDPMKVLGKILEKYLDDDPPPGDFHEEFKKAINSKIRTALVRSNINYIKGGIVAATDAPQVAILEEEIAKLNVEAVDYEFKRAVGSVEHDPYEAVSASCNILESVFKVILERRGCDKPKVQDISNLWKAVKKELQIDSGSVEDQDVLTILSGLSAVVGGVGSLRTHASSAHGRGSFRYPLKARHVLLAIHSAHTLALFVLQTVKERED